MNNQNNNIAWWKPGLTIFVKVSASIAVPIIIALYLGRYFDNKFNTDPWFFLGLTVTAFLVSLYSIWKNIVKYIKTLEEETKNKNK